MDKKTKISLLNTMLKIRKFEEKTIQLYQNNKIWGHLHPCIGQEAIASGACLALNKDDYILSTHRGHGHCIAKGGDIRKMINELLGKEAGCCKGRGGSMHIADIEHGILGANGIVGGGLPISVGVGIGCKQDDSKRVVICFFGEGAVNNGVFHEALNMASIFILPIVFICENNLYAVSANIKNVMSENNISKKSISYDMPGITVDGMDVEKVHLQVMNAVKRARSGKGPTLIEAQTYRFYGHHLQDAQIYRDKKELEYYKKNKDPISNYISRLIEEKVINRLKISEIEEIIEEEIDLAITEAEKLPEPSLALYLEEIRDY